MDVAGATACKSCAVGTRSDAGYETCTSCAVGKYQELQAQTTCKSCLAGRYAASIGSSSCVFCTPGKYSNAGASDCTNCPAGRFGTVDGASSSSCSGDCPVGKYSTAGSTQCTSCLAGLYSDSTGSAACTNCPAGRYGETGAASATCTGSCSAGYYCEAGSATSDAAACGSADKYCPAGAETPTTATPGYFTHAGDPASPGAVDVRTTQSICPIGYYCVSGAKTKCPPGRYGTTTGLSASTCTGPCTAGYYCQLGSTSSTPTTCGSANKYCPSGSGAPKDVQSGYYSTPTTAPEDKRTGEAQCPAGKVCVDGVMYKPAQFSTSICPNGVAKRVIAENQASGTGAGSAVEATRMGGYSGAVSYSILSTGFSSNAGCALSSPPFSVSDANGQLNSTAAINYEVCSSFTFTVRVTAGTEYDDCSVTVAVTDINEGPTFSNCPGGAATLSVNEKVSVDTPVGIAVAATDVDIGQALSYSLSSSSTPFKVGACDGQVKVKQNTLNYQTQQSYVLTLKVEDDGSPKLSATCQVTVNVVNVNDAPELTGSTTTVNENIAAGTVVATAQGTDEDGNTGLTYSIHRQDGTTWTIDSSTGQIKVAASASINYESKSQHSIGVQVSDGSLNAKADFIVNINDLNDAPVLSGPSVLSVAENTATGEPVGNTFAATDEDANHQANLAWSITSSSTAYTISSSGQLYLTGPAPSFEGSEQSVEVAVRVTDPGGVSSTKTVTVKTTDVNESPSMASPPTLSIAEDAADGTAIGSALQASDEDSSQTLTWSITSGNNGALKIDSSLGQLRVSDTKLLDYESLSSYSLNVQVCDNGSPSLCADDTVVVKVNDTTEPPVFSAQSRSIAELTAVGTAVGDALSVSDPDAGDSVSCSITDGNAGAAFSFDASSCQLRVQTSSALNYESRPAFLLTVRATDTAGKYVDAAVTVAVTNVNEAPVISNAGANRTVPELAPAAWVVSPELAAVDVDANDALTWSIQSSTPQAMQDMFEIVSSSGRLKTKATLGSDITPSTNFLNVKVTDSGGLYATASVVIVFSDSNRPPTMTAASMTIAESAAITTALSPAMAATDPDSDPVTYAITSGNTGGAFAINPSTGVISVAKTLDFETTSSYSLQITATDAPGVKNGVTQPPLSVSSTASVTVSNVNEAPTLAATTFSVAENTADGSNVGTALVGSDQDSGDTITYSIATGNSAGAFAIDSSSGQLTVAKKSALNYESTTEFALDIKVQDQGGASSTGRVTISVTNENDAPVVSQPASATITENLAVGTTVGSKMTFSDEDGDTVTFSITSGNSLGTFALSSAGVLSIAKSPNFEQATSYQLVITGSDGQGASHSVSWSLAVSDVAENPEYEAPLTASLAEDSAVGALIATVQASDEDTADADALACSLTGQDAALFAVDSSTCKLTLAKVLDRETAASHAVRVVVTDTKGLTAFHDLTITVLDVNEAPTIVTTSLSVAETAATGATVGTLTATDQDVGQSVAFSITSGNGPAGAEYFSISQNANTKEAQLLLAAAAIDYEEAAGARKEFSLTVTAVDSDTANPLSHSQTVTIKVLDKNEAPVVNDATRTVRENAAVNTPVGDPIPATDQDAGQELSYKFLSGNSDGHFKIDKCSGQIKVAASDSLNFESKNSYTLSIEVRDDGGSVPGPANLYDTATITVNLIDVNEAPSVPAQSFSIDENSAVDLQLGSANVQVLDQDPADTHTFSIVGGNTNNAFAVAPATGRLSVKTPSALNYEVTPSFSLNVSVVDDGTSPAALTGWGIVTVSLNDINEAPKFNTSNPAAKPSVPENPSGSTQVGAPLPGYDEDAGQSLTWSLTGGDHASLFTIEAATGQLYTAVGASINYETQKTLYINVTATDDDGTSPLSSTFRVPIKVTNVNEQPEIEQGIAVSIAENSAAATTVSGTADLGSDVDEGDTLTYSLLTQTVANAFRVIQSSGAIEVLTASKVNHEALSSHVIGVRVTDAGGMFADTTVTVTVTDVNEAPVLASGQRRSVSENSQNEDIGMALSVTDVDDNDVLTFAVIAGGSGATYTSYFTIGNSSGVLATTATAALNFEKKDEVTIRVRVTDSGGLSHEQDVAISVQNVNEAPTLSKSLFEFNVAESATKDLQIGLVSAIDVDAGDSLLYSMNLTSVTSGGGAALTSHFVMDPVTGVIAVLKTSPQSTSDYFTIDNTYEGVVTATDGGQLQSSAAISITITAVNDPPVLGSANLSVAENAAASTSVGTVTATDPDVGDTVTYSLINKQDVFNINSQNGDITVKDPSGLNFEKTPSMTVTVGASDGQLSVTRDYTLALVDVNEAPALTSSSLLMSTTENPAQVGGLVGTIVATDPDAADSPVVGKLAFALTDNGGKGHFALDAATGALTVSTLDLDYEATASYSIGVQVTDTAGNTASGTVTLTVTNTNDQPRIGDSVASVQENAAVGATVLASLPGTDQDTSQQLQFAMGLSPCFAYDTSSARSLQYAPLPADDAMDVTVSVVGSAGDLGRKRAGTFSVLLAEQASAAETYKTPTGPYYQLLGTSSSVTLKRCSASGTCTDLGSSSAAGVGAMARFRIVVDQSSTVDSVTVAGSLGSSALDSAWTQLIAVQEDGGALNARRVGLSLSATSTNRIYACYNSDEYSVTSSTFAVDASTGAVTVGTSAALDYEGQRWYGFEVYATDSAPAPASSRGGVVVVSLTDQNEAPSWTGSSACASAGGDSTLYVGCFSIDENSAASATNVIGTIAATDPDTLASQSLTYSVQADGNSAPDGSKVFVIDSSTGAITLNKAVLNHEAKAVYTLLVSVQDDGAGGLSASAKVRVDVADVNEAPTVVAGSRTVPENSGADTTVIGGAVVASDVDTNTEFPWGALTYSIVGGTGSSLFDIDSTSGTLRVASNLPEPATVYQHPLNFEQPTKNSYTVTVRATDGGGLSAQATYTIAVTNVNEAPAILDATRAIAEDAPGLEEAGNPVLGQDPDNEVSTIQQLRYSIIGGTGAAIFKIDPCSGQIKLAVGASLDFEELATYSLTIQLQDDADTPLSDTAAVTVNVLDANDAPKVAEPIGGYVLSVQELCAVGTEVPAADGSYDRLSATDQDESSTQATKWANQTWSITTGNQLGIFAIHPATGGVTVAKPSRMDFEDDNINVFVLGARVCDSGKPALCDDTTFTVNVLDKNEAPAVGDVTITMAESTPEQPVVANSVVSSTITATDVDAGDEALLAFTLVNVPMSAGGSAAPLFSVSSSGATAEIRVTAAGVASIDHEAVSQYAFKLRVTDSGGLFDESSVTVAVTDVNEAPVLADAALTIAENSPVNTKATGTVSMVDVDDGDSHTYTVVSGAPEGMFEVAQSPSLFLRLLVNALDFETTDTYTLVIEVTDRGGLGLSDQATWTVTVTDEQESPTLSDRIVASVDENVAGVIATIQGADPDAADVGQLKYTIEATPASPQPTRFGAPIFGIDLQTGQLSILAPTASSLPNYHAGEAQSTTDYETTTQHQVKVRVTDSALNFVVATITVPINDVNEAPYLAPTSFSTPAESDSQLGFLTDPAILFDSDDNSHVFSIVSGNTEDTFALAASTGALSVLHNDTVALRYDETKATNNEPNFVLTVQARDTGGLVGQGTVKVFVTNANQQPKFVTNLAKLPSLNENMPTGTLVATIVATDHNSQDSLTYSVAARGVNINRPFPFVMETDASTGQGVGLLKVHRRPQGQSEDLPLNFEGAFSQYAIMITVQDNHDPLALSISGEATISLDDVDEAPTIVSPTGVADTDPITMTVPENSQGITLPGFNPISATDQDHDDPASSLRFSIVSGSGNAASSFDIDARTGSVSYVGAASAVDFEAFTQAFTFKVRVTDSKGLTGERDVSVSVTDVNEAPQLAKATFAFTVEEGAQAGVAVGTVVATEEDTAGSDFATLTYALSDPSGAGLEGAFAIDSQGRVTVADQAHLDWESRAEYHLLVTVTDSAPVVADRLSDSSSVVISVIDINDMAIDGFFVEDASVQARSAWNVVPPAGSNATAEYPEGSPIDWAQLPSTKGLEVVLSTAGGAEVFIKGSNLGRTAERLAREGHSDANDVATVTATYGPGDGTRYTARSCRIVVPGFQVACVVDEGIGLNHKWLVAVAHANGDTGSTNALASATVDSGSFLSGYAPPHLTAAEAVAADAQTGGFQTRGGEKFIVRGENIGPMDTDVRVSFTTAANRGRTLTAVGCAVVEAHAAIQCTMPAGIGPNATVTVAAAQQPSNAFKTPLRYASPAVSAVSQFLLATEGGETMLLNGTNFGPPGTGGVDVSARYHNGLSATSGSSGAYAFQAVGCIAVDHELLRCKTVPGVGQGHAWVVTVGKQASQPSASPNGLSTYKSPIILSIGGQGADLADTTGGQVVTITGANFGPATVTDADGNIVSRDLPVVKYGHANATTKLTADNCKVITAYKYIECFTVPGTGKDLLWEVAIASQSSGAFELRPTSYHPPVVAYYSGVGAKEADTRGDQRVIIEGRNFGPLGTVVESVQYGKGETKPFRASNCSVYTAHSMLECLTAVGAGADLSWSVRIDGQDSVAPTTDYHVPVIDSFSGPGAADASTDGGDLVNIHGDFFSVAQHLGVVTYGPSGVEFVAKNCHVVEQHVTIQCTTVPGTGRRQRWMVTIGDQRSALSDASTSYAGPVITSVAPQEGPTSGFELGSSDPVMLRIKGRNFAMDFEPATQVVRFEVDGAEAPTSEQVEAYREAVLGGASGPAAGADVFSWLHSLQEPRVEASGVGDDGLDYIDIILPPGFGTARDAFVEVDGVLSEAATYQYAAPEIFNVAPDRRDVQPGELRVFIDGENFCSGVGCGSMLVDGDEVVPLKWSDTQILFVIVEPTSTAQQLNATVVVDGVSSNSILFRKPVPSFSAAEQGRVWDEMIATGGEPLKLLHIAAISTVPVEDMILWIGPYNVSTVVKFQDAVDIDKGTNSIEFESPPGVGVDLDVILQITGGAKSRANSGVTFSYRPPEITGLQNTGGSSVQDEGMAASRRQLDSQRQLASKPGLMTVGDVLVLRGSGFGSPELGGNPVLTMDGSTQLDIISHRDDQIEARVPAGDGDGHAVAFIVGQQDSRTFGKVGFRYAFPTVARAYVCGGGSSPTAGGASVCIEGSNLGVSRPSIFINGEFCETDQSALYPQSVGHDFLNCTSPEGEGAAAALEVIVNGQSTGSTHGVSFRYDRPVITGMTPDHGPTSGADPPIESIAGELLYLAPRFNITITGENFGVNLPTISFRAGPAMQTLTATPEDLQSIFVPTHDMHRHNHTAITFSMPEGFGLERHVYMDVAGQESLTFALFVYDAPSVASFRRADMPPGACVDRLRCTVHPEDHVKNETCRTQPAECEVCRSVPAECWDTRGQYVLQVLGESFGRPGDASVEIGGRPCVVSPDLQADQTHNAIFCKAPRGFGENLPVVVTVGSRSSASSTRFTYDPPLPSQIVPNRPRATGERIQIQGKNFGWEKQPVSIFVSGLECQNALWINDGAVECDAQADVAGLKNVTILAANRTEPYIVYEREDKVAFECKGGEYGVYGEVCLNCEDFADGAVCPGSESFFDEVVSMPGWWRFNVSHTSPDCIPERRLSRVAYEGADGQTVNWCPLFRPCEPLKACVGNNTCALGYTGSRCDSCITGFYRYNGDCERCPDSPWMLVAMFGLGAICACFAGWVLNSRQVNVAFIAIGVDYFQVLALFARAKVRWPPMLRGLFKFMSAFNLNIELAAPECALPDITYGQKWFFSMALPIAMLVVLAVLYCLGYLYKLCVLRKSAKERHGHVHKIISISVISLYVMYVYLTRMTLDVFNCSPTDPPDGKSYMAGMTDIPCYESKLHQTLIPFAALTFLCYVIALPVLAFVILYKNKYRVKHDQICRAIAGKDERYLRQRFITDDIWFFRQRWNRLYYLFKPGKWYWIAVVLARKFAIAFSALMFRNTPSYQLAVALLVMFTSYVIQVKHLPYMSPGDYDGELQKHIMMAEMPGKEGKTHKRIRDIMEAVERQNEKEMRRSGVRGSWREAAKRMYMAKAAGAGNTDEDVNYLAMFLIDYNSVEAVLLACGVLVCLSGIMFLSARFNGDLAEYYAREYDGLAVTVATIISLSLLYFTIVLSFEIFYLLDKKRAAQLVSACSRRARKMAAKSRRERAKAVAAAGGAMGASKEDEESMGLEQNALVMMKKDEIGLEEGDDDWLEAGIPNAPRWAIFKSEFKAMKGKIKELTAMLRSRENEEAPQPQAALLRGFAKKKSRRRSRGGGGATRGFLAQMRPRSDDAADGSGGAAAALGAGELAQNPMFGAGDASAGSSGRRNAPMNLRSLRRKGSSRRMHRQRQTGSGAGSGSSAASGSGSGAAFAAEAAEAASPANQVQSNPLLAASAVEGEQEE